MATADHPAICMGPRVGYAFPMNLSFPDVNPFTLLVLLLVGFALFGWALMVPGSGPVAS